MAVILRFALLCLSMPLLLACVAALFIGWPLLLSRAMELPLQCLLRAVDRYDAWLGRLDERWLPDAVERDRPSPKEFP